MTETNDRYIRGLTLVIGPLTEAEQSDGQSAGGQEAFVSLTTTGRYDEFRVQFSVYKSSLGAPPNASKIKVYNLAKDTTSRIAARFTSCSIELTYGNPIAGGTGVLLAKSGTQTSLGLLTSGAVTVCYDERPNQDGNIVTNIDTYDGINGTALGLFNVNYVGKQEVSQIVEQLISSMPGIKKGTIKLSSQTGSKGLTMAGRSVDVLNRLSSQYGFTWWINDGALNASDDGVATGNLYDISAADGNLLNVSPILADTVQKIIGVVVNIIMDPRIQPNDQVSITSVVAPKLNGVYTVTNITHNGDTHGASNTWRSEIECLDTYLINSGGNL